MKDRVELSDESLYNLTCF